MKKRILKKALSIMLTVSMAVSLLVGFPLTASAEQGELSPLMTEAGQLGILDFTEVTDETASDTRAQ
jgi:hypothetical protein